MLLATAEPFADPVASAPHAEATHRNDHATALKLFHANQRLAFHVANSFQPSARRLGIDRDDLLQAALLGLWLACQRFDASLGWKFSTFGYRGVANGCHQLLHAAQRQDREWALPQDLRQHDGLTVLDLAEAAPEADPAGDQAEARELLRPMIDALPDRLRLVIELRHGLTDAGTLTLEEIGGRLGVTRERVRQLEHDAFRGLLRARRLAGEHEKLRHRR